jgi:hypothetical protein
MPTRKQRRRRAKELRHEYVWEDAEGNELDPEEAPTRKPDAVKRAQAPRRGREPQRPSWRRTFRRGLIFLPIMFVVISFLAKGQGIAFLIEQTVLIAFIFIPFSYFLDAMFWRSYQRRLARHAGSNGQRRS